MRYDEALAWLDRRTNREAVAGRVDDLSTDAIERVLHVLGDPHRAQPAIHVTGTNGKGSVAHIVTALLRAHGLTVGTYTSPHLDRVTERIRWDGEEMSEDAFGATVAAVADAEALAGVELSWFEAVTAVALTWFAEVAVDVAVVEVGLLGRYDATNVVDADVAVLTNVALDHTDGAAGWRQAVAEEKLGIAKPGATLVLGEVDDELESLLAGLDVAAVWRPDEDVELLDDRTAVGGRVLAVRTPHGTLEELFLPLHGAHQARNAATAIAAVTAFFDRPLTEGPVGDGLAAVELPGRLEVLGRSPLVVVDGAHNAAAVAAALDGLEESFVVDGRSSLVLGVLADKDLDGIVDALDVRGWDRVLCTTPLSPRALPADELAAHLADRDVVCEVEADPARAVERAVDLARDDDVVLVIGSTYLAAVARRTLLEL